MEIVNDVFLCRVSTLFRSRLKPHPKPPPYPTTFNILHLKSEHHEGQIQHNGQQKVTPSDHCHRKHRLKSVNCKPNRINEDSKGQFRYHHNAYAIDYKIKLGSLQYSRQFDE